MSAILKRVSILAASTAIALIALAAHEDFSKDELKMLQDPGGWEYVTVSDQDAGVQTQHVCFDGAPHPGECSGTLTLNAGKTFVKQVNIHGQSVNRHGTYELDDHRISFFDEFGTRDGPYDLQLNSDSKSLVLSMPQVRIELELESQYKDDLQQKKPPRH